MGGSSDSGGCVAEPGAAATIVIARLAMTRLIDCRCHMMHLPLKPRPRPILEGWRHLALHNGNAAVVIGADCSEQAEDGGGEMHRAEAAEAGPGEDGGGEAEAG